MVIMPNLANHYHPFQIIHRELNVGKKILTDRKSICDVQKSLLVGLCLTCVLTGTIRCYGHSEDKMLLILIFTGQYGDNFLR